MKDTIFIRKRGETKPPIFNPKKCTLSPSDTNYPIIFKGKDEIDSIVTLLMQRNATAKNFSEKPLTQIRNETASSGNNSFLVKIFQNLDMLNQLPTNWDGYNAEKPNIKAIEKARSFFCSFENIFFILPNSLSNPNISANSEGDIMLEWWFHDKKLSVYATPKHISYIKVAGERIEDMEDGFLGPENPNQLQDLFIWLIG